MLQIITGNMLDANVEALVNTVNTIGVMGKGIALQFKNAFRKNYSDYLAACKSGTFDIGELLIVKDHNINLGEKLIINFPTKKHWRQPSKYEYIEVGLQALVKCINDHQIKSIALPPLGCGNGGLDWSIVKPMIEKHLSPLDADIFVYEPNDSVKEILQKEVSVTKAKLTPARAMLLYSLFYYEALGEHTSLFSANKLAYFLQHRMGEKLTLNFQPYKYGPYASGVQHVLLSMNGTYLYGLEQNQATAFEPLKLNYNKFGELEDYIDKNLTTIQKIRLKELTRFITGFESDLSIEILASVAFILEKDSTQTLEQVAADVTWTTRKKQLFKPSYIEIAYNHLKKHDLDKTIFGELLSS
jgi:O-acetyl-ADP-ribose deacetylase (regulator of RNase III)